MNNGPNEFWITANEFLNGDAKVGMYGEKFVNDFAELLCQEHDKGYWQGRREKIDEIKKVLKE
jgi:hypothetical protein